MKKTKVLLGLVSSFIFTLMLFGSADAASFFLKDSYNYCWNITQTINNPTAVHFDGKVKVPGETSQRDASVTYVKSNGGVTMDASAGTGVDFHYGLKWVGSSGSGAWMNTTNAVSDTTGLVTVSGVASCAMTAADAQDQTAPVLGPAPGVE